MFPFFGILCSPPKPADSLGRKLLDNAVYDMVLFSVFLVRRFALEKNIINCLFVTPDLRLGKTSVIVTEHRGLRKQFRAQSFLILSVDPMHANHAIRISNSLVQLCCLAAPDKRKHRQLLLNIALNANSSEFQVFLSFG